MFGPQSARIEAEANAKLKRSRHVQEHAFGVPASPDTADAGAMFVFRQGRLGHRYSEKSLLWTGARCYDFAMPRDFSAYKSVQARTKSVLENLRSVLSPAASESSVAAEAIRRLTDAGMPHTWYYNCPDAPEFRSGYKCLERLHSRTREFVTADTTL